MRELLRPSFVRHVRAGIAVLGLLHAVGCTKDRAFVDVVGSGRPGRPDASTASDAGGAGADSTAQPDGGTAGGNARQVDAAAADSSSASADASTNDTDAGDTTPEVNPVESCAVADEQSELTLDVPFSDEAGFALTPGTIGFGVAWKADECGAIATLPVQATGAYPEPQLHFGGCSAVVEEVSLLHVTSGFRMVWVDNVTGSAELQARIMPDALVVPGELGRDRVTTNDRRELRPTQWRQGDASYLGWISQGPRGETQQIELRSMDPAAEPHTLVAADSGFAPTRLALAQVGKDHGVLVFVSERDRPGAFVLPLDSAAMPVGAPVLLSAAVSTGNAIDVATRPANGGAVVYSVDVGTDHEVRFRRLSPEGAFLSDEIKLTVDPLQARDAGIARLGDGYVVAFRSLPTSLTPKPEIRLMFLTKEGNVQRDHVGRLITYPLVTDASSTGGRISVRISTDGQMLIGFVDSYASGSKLRLIRKRLDCAL